MKIHTIKIKWIHASFRFPVYCCLMAFFCIATVVSCAGKQASLSGNEELYVSKVFLSGGFTSIEGPACDIDGNLYAVNYAKQGTIGKVTPEGQASLFVELPAKSVGNGIRFNSKNFMFIADYVNHNIFKVDMKTREISTYAHESTMYQPNDIAIGANDIIYASDLDWGKLRGRIWRIDKDGKVTLLENMTGTSNGIEVGADEKTLYVNECLELNVWAYDLSKDGKTSNKRLLINLSESLPIPPSTPKNRKPALDGMRCDIAGNLYITCLGVNDGKVIKVSPKGKILKEIMTINKPTNLTFGGPDGRTCYVTTSGNSLEVFRVDLPGRLWKRH